jgi:conjugal transfer pilus assembly protein TrbC
MTLYLTTSVLVDNPHYQEGIQSGERILREQLKREVSLVCEKTMPKNSPITKKRCSIFPMIDPDPETSLYVFMSFSVPDEAWLALSEEIVQKNGIMVLRGLPGNSFQELAKKIHSLRSRGMKATVQIDPMLFSRFNIDKVPSFVKTTSKGFYKVSGNVSLRFALEKIAQQAVAQIEFKKSHDLCDDYSKIFRETFEKEIADAS